MPTERKIYNIEIIGFGLTFLYAVSCIVFINYLIIPELKLKAVIYIALFALLCISSVGVMTLKEWGRRLLIGLNGIMLICLVIRFIPKVDLVPLAYLFLNIIVLLYFTQGRIKLQFRKGKSDAWNKSILLIDDDETIHKVVRPILFSYGYSVLTATTGEDGLLIARTQKPDLILLDVILPGIKGREVCKELKANPETEAIPVVFLTAKDSQEDIQAEIEVGSSGHLTKPVTAKVLVETIRGVLGPKKGNQRKNPV